MTLSYGGAFGQVCPARRVSASESAGEARSLLQGSARSEGDLGSP